MQKVFLPSMLRGSLKTEGPVQIRLRQKAIGPASWVRQKKNIITLAKARYPDPDCLLLQL